jgi:hypothetical protein
MFEKFKLKKKKTQLQKLTDRKQQNRKEGYKIVDEKNKKTSTKPYSYDYWQVFAPQELVDEWNQVALDWYKLRYGENRPGDLTFSDISKKDIIDLSDLRSRMYKVLYPEQYERHQNSLTVTEDKSVKVGLEFDSKGTWLTRDGVREERGAHPGHVDWWKMSDADIARRKAAQERIAKYKEEQRLKKQEPVDDSVI